MSWSSALLIALLASAAQAGPTGRLLGTSCVETCRGGNNFLYKIGEKYEYLYEVKAENTLSTTDFSNLELSALITIQPVTPCEFSLSLSDVTLKDSVKSDEFSAAVTENSIRFSFQDGKVEHLCAAQKEAEWILNFKRGILSHFQNSLTEFVEGEKELREEDFNGLCDTSYKVSKSDDDSSLVVSQEKDLTKCHHGSNLKASLLSLGFERDYSDVSKGILATSSCTKEIKESIYQKITCVQDFNWLRPFVKHDMKVSSFLTLQAVKKGEPDFYDLHPVRSSLLFKEVEKKRDIAFVEKILSDLKESRESVQKDTPRNFFDLVKALSSMTFQELEILDLKTKKDSTYKFFYDALLLVGTPDAMKMVISKKIPQVDMNIWLTSLSFIKDPTLPMFHVLTSLVMEERDQKPLLAISSMVRNYCKKDHECHLRPEIEVILRSFESHLRDNCIANTPQEVMEITTALKAIGNAGRFVNAEEHLKKCYQETSNKMQIRISAIEAWRNTPCEYDRSHLLSTYQDATQNTELRIASYLAVMKCPTETLVSTVKDRLSSESVNQVGSFVWSHLSNLQESADPEKLWVRTLIGDETLQKKFTSENVKLSKYYESSFYSESLKMGGNAEADVIFSPDSYLPRSGMLNLTLDVFGQPINLIELGGRMQGFEALIEKFFGPDGYYPDTTMQGILKNLREAKERENGKIFDGSDGVPDGSFFIKLFGNELFHRQFHGIDILGFLSNSNPISKIIDMLRKGPTEFTKSFNLLDKTVTFPSIIGFPVNLNMKSSATVSLQIEGNVHFRGFSNMAITGKLKPSASVISDSSIEIDAFVTSSITTIKRTAHTDTTLSGRAIVDGLRVVEFKLDLPEKMELFTKSHEWYISKDGVETKLIENSNPIVKSCSQLLYFSFCKDYESNTILSLPHSSRYYITGPSAKSYVFRADFKHKPGYTRDFSLLFDIVGAPYNLKHMISLTFNEESFDFKVDSPNLKVKSTGRYEIDTTGIKATGDLLLNDHLYYSTALSYVYSIEREGLVFTSKLLLRNSKEVAFEFNGDIIMDWTFKKMTYKFNTDGILGKNLLEFEFDRTVTENPKTSLEISTKMLKLKTHGSAVIQPDKFEINTEGNYHPFYLTEPRSLDTTFKIERKKEGDAKTYSAALAAGFLDLEADWETKLEPAGFSNKGTYKRDDHEWKHDSHILITQVDKTKKLDIRLLLHCPVKSMTYLFEKKVEVSDQHVKQASDIEFGSFRGSTNVYIEYWKYARINAEYKVEDRIVYSVNFLLEQQSNGQWTLKADAQESSIDLTFHDKSTIGETFDYKIKGSVSSTMFGRTHGYDLGCAFKASKSNLDLDLSYNLASEEQAHFVVAKASPSELTFDTNIYKPFSIVAKFVPKETGRGFEITGNVDSNEVIKAVAIYSGTSIEASLKYSDVDMSFLVSLLDSGWEAKVRWAPTKEISSTIRYEIGDNISLLAGWETPFEGWEKQQIRLLFSSESLRDIKGQVSITWGNENFFTGTLNHKLETNIEGHTYKGLFRVTSSLEIIEIASFEIDHSIDSKKVTTDIECKYNEKKLSSEFKVVKSEDKYEANYSFNFPSRDVSVQSSALITIKDKLVTLSANAEGSVITPITVKGKYERTDSVIDIFVNGKFGDKFVKLTANGEGKNMERKLRLQFLSSLTEDFDLSYDDKLSDDSTLTADVIVSSIIHPGEKYKVQVLANFEKLDKVHVYLKGPKISGKVKFSNQKRGDGSCETLVEANVNDHSFILNGEGEIDMTTLIGSYNVDTKSTFKYLDGIGIKYIRSIEKEGTSLDVFIKKGYDFHSKFYLLHKDERNFESKLNFNNKYKFDLLSKKDTKKVDLDFGESGRFKFELIFRFQLFIIHKANLLIRSPWTPTIELGIDPKEDREIVGNFKIEPYVELNLKTKPFGSNSYATGAIKSQKWNSELDFDFTWAYRFERGSLKINTNIDPLNIVGNIHASLDNKDFNGGFEVKSQTGDFRPISFKTSGNFVPIEKRFLIEFDLGQEHQFDFDFNLNLQKMEILGSSKLTTPFISESPFKVNFEGEYSTPHFELTVNDGSHLYKLIASLENRDFFMSFKCPMAERTFEAKWSSNLNNYDIKYKVEDSQAEPRTYLMKIEFDLNERSGFINLDWNKRIFKLTCKHEDKSYILNAITPIDNWEKMNAVISYKGLLMEIHFAKNDQKYSAKSFAEIEDVTGSYSFEVITPIPGYEKNKLKFNYEKSEEAWEINFLTNIGKDEFMLKNSVIFNDGHPKITFVTHNPFINKFQIDFDQTSASKSLNVAGYDENSKKILFWNFKIQPGMINFDFNSDKLNYKLKGSFEKQANNLKSMIRVVKDDIERIYSIQGEFENDNLKLNIETPIPKYRKLIVDGKYEHINEIHKLITNIKLEELEYNLYCEVTPEIAQPEIRIVLKNQDKPLANMNVKAKVNTNRPKQLDFSILVGDTEYSGHLYVALNRNEGRIESSFNIPFSKFSELSINGNYDFDDKIKAELDILRGEEKIYFSANGKFIRNSPYHRRRFVMDFITPFEGYERIHLNGHYADLGRRYDYSAGASTKSLEYRISGTILEKEEGYSIETKIPYYYGDEVTIAGDINNEKISLRINSKRDSIKSHKINLHYHLDTKKSFIKMQTTFDSLKYLELFGSTDILDDGTLAALVNVAVNEQKLKFEGKFKYSMYDSLILMSAETSVPNEIYYFKTALDLVTNNNRLELILKTPTLNKELTLYSNYVRENPYKATFIVTTSVEDYGKFGFSYDLSISSEKREYFAKFEVMKNEEVYPFGVEGIFNKQRLLTKIILPIENFESNLLDVSLDIPNLKGSLKFKYGKEFLNSEVSLNKYDFYFKTSSSHKDLLALNLISKLFWKDERIFINWQYEYKDLLNHNLYQIYFDLSKLGAMGLEFKVATPFEFIKNFEIIGVYDPTPNEDILKLGYGFNDIKYFFSTGFNWSGCGGNIRAKVVAPFIDEIVVKGEISLGDSLNLFVKRSGHKDIVIRGKFSDEEVGFDFETEDFETKLNYDRTKRSLDMYDQRMMNDHHHPKKGIVANFKSLKVTLNTPYERVKKVNLDISKSSSGFEFNYIRGENHVKLSLIANPKKNGFDVSIKSAIPGWEILALTGRLNEEELMGYLTGQLNEKQMTISGSGLITERTGSINVEILTPFKGYEKVTVVGKYNARRRDISIQATAENNDKFKFLIEFKRGLTIDIFIPHDEQPTVVDGKLSIYSGELNIKSRFEPIKQYALKYGLAISKAGVKADFSITRNNEKRFNFEYEKNPKKKINHFMLMIKLFGNKSAFHYHREAFKTLEVSFTRNDKTLELKATGTGKLPEKGKIKFKITNSFRLKTKTVDGTVNVDRSGKTKKLNIEAKYTDGMPWKFKVDYHIDLEKLEKGDYTLKIITPDKMLAEWKDIKGKWDLTELKQEEKNAYVSFSIGKTTITATGRIYPENTDVVIKTEISHKKSSEKPVEDLYFGYKFVKTDTARDYYLKFGKKSRYVMAKLKGIIDGLDKIDLSAEFRASKFMENDFKTTLKLDRDMKEESKFTGSGTINYGETSISHTLNNYKRNAAKHAGEFDWEATTNIDNYKSITFKGEYSVAERKLDFKLAWDNGQYFELKGKLDNFSLKKSKNVVSVHLPKAGDGKLTLSHDFTNELAKTISAEGNFGDKAVSYKLKITRDKHYTAWKLHEVVKSVILGDVEFTLGYDFSDMNNAMAMLKYNRNKDKFVDINWTRVVEKESLSQLFTFKTHIDKVPYVKAYINASWITGDGYKYVHGIEIDDRITELSVNLGNKKGEFSFKTPSKLISDIKAVANYNLFKGKVRTFDLDYTRGDVKIKLNFKLELEKKKSSKNGALKLTFKSPYKIAKTLSIDVSWVGGKLTGDYRRNDVHVKINGKADAVQGKASYEISFTPPGKSPVNLKLSYDIDDFKMNKGTKIKKIFDIDFNFEGHTIAFKVDGYRNPGKVYLDISGTTSFTEFKSFDVLLDSELDLSMREGHLKIRVDDFEFDMKNNMINNKQRFYWSSLISSSITPLPGIKVGFGKEKSTYTLVLGVGDEKEMKEATFIFKGKGNFKKGFSGKINIPHRDIKNAAFDVSYSFKGENKLDVDLVVDLGDGKKIEADIVYNSDGVKSRLSTPWTGMHGLRLRRSISDDYFTIEAGINEHNCQFSLRNSLNRGYLIDAVIFEKHFGLDIYLDRHQKEGRFIIKTPFKNFKKVGGQFLILPYDRYGFEFNAVLHLIKKVDLAVKFGSHQLESLLNVDNRKIVLLSANFEAYKTLKLDVNFEAIFLSEPINFSYIFYMGNENAGTAHLSGFFGEHIVELMAIGRYPNMRFTFKTKSEYLPSDIEVTYNRRFPLRNFEISSKRFSIKYDFEQNDKEVSFKVSSRYEPLFNFALEASNVNSYLFAIDATALNEKVKFSSKIDLDRTSYTGTGYFIFSKDQLSIIRLFIERDDIETKTEVTLNNNEKHTLKVIFKSPILQGTELSIDFDYPDLPKISIHMVRWIDRPFKINFDYANGNRRYAILLSGFKDVENQFLKAELVLPTYSLPLSMHLKHYNLEKIRGLKIELIDGNRVHTLSGKVSYEKYSGKVHLLAESPMLLVTKKAYFNLAYDFQENFKVFVEVMENEETSHSFYVILNPVERSIFANVVTPHIWSGLAKVEGRIGEFSSTGGDAQLFMGNSQFGLAFNVRGKMLENEADVYVNVQTPFEGFKNMKFGGKMLKGSLTKVILFAEPFGFKAMSSFGVVDSTVKFGMELHTDVETWKDSTVVAEFPLNTFNPHVSVTVGSKQYGLTLYYKRTDTEGRLSWNKVTPVNKSEFEIYYNNKAPFEYGFNLEGADIKKNAHITFDSSFLVFSNVFMALL